MSPTSSYNTGAPETVLTPDNLERAFGGVLRHFVLGLTDLAAMGIPPGRVLHVGQSLRADVRPGNLLGLDTVFINRPGRGLGHKGFGAELAVPAATYSTMAAFVADFLGV